MSLNTNGTIDIPKTVRELWPSMGGMFFVWVLEVVLSFWLYQTLQLDAIVWLGVWGLFLFVTTFIIWTIHTKRWFQRTGYIILLSYLGIIGIGVCVYYGVYPKIIAGTRIDWPFIRYWGTALFVVFSSGLLYFCYFNGGKRDDLWIVFLVSNRSCHERDIKKSLEEARNQIERITRNIHIIIPPFGIANGISQCERYINGHFNQADAVIFASMTDSSEGSEFGYKFTRFTSRISKRYIKTNKGDEIDIDHVLTESQKGREWNTLNISKDDISRTLEVAGNLKDLFLMYVSCIYLYKHRYSEAITVTDQIYTYRATGNITFDNVVKDLMANAYVTAARAEEQENRDFDRANALLEECIRKLPQVRYSLPYKLALARLHYYNNNLHESKKVTKSVKASFPWAEWYWTINLAFYAIYERKPKEVYTHYKHLLKAPYPTREEVEFSIRFQEKELKDTIDDQYRLFLYHGLAFLNLYVNEKKSKRYIEMADVYANIEGYEALARMRELINNSRGKLKLFTVPTKNR